MVFDINVCRSEGFPRPGRCAGGLQHSNDASNISVAQIFLYLQLKYFFIFSSNISLFTAQIFLNFHLKYFSISNSNMSSIEKVQWNRCQYLFFFDGGWGFGHSLIITREGLILTLSMLIHRDGLIRRKYL